MITMRWLICNLLVCILLHLLGYALFGAIAIWSVWWWVKIIAIGIIAVPIANWITGD